MTATVHNHYFHVEGVRCARCIHAIESALTSEPSVTNARVNMSTNRLSLSWVGESQLMQHFITRIEALGYTMKPFEASESDTSEDRRLIYCMAIAGFAMGNLMLLSAALWSSEQAVMGIATRDLLHWISALIALPTIAYAGRPFFASALGALMHKHTNMDVPISLALILTSAMSLFETVQNGEHVYFDSAVMLLFFLLIGRWLDARARNKARSNAEDLLAMMQGHTTVVEEGRQRSIPIAELQQNMLVRIAAGEKIPTDVKIIEGCSELDTSLVTGETLPQAVSVGSTAYGGTINLNAPLICRVLRTSEDSLLADIVRLMEKAEQGRARYVRLADKAAKLYTPVVHSLALFTFLGWLLIGGLAWQEALLIAVTTLIITCPCALGLAVPVVQVLATSWLMKRGILIKSGDALERLAAIDTIVLDKTGTLTKGKPTLMNKLSAEHLQLAASLAAQSKHPYSQAISEAYAGELLPVEQGKEMPGVGVEGTIQGHVIRLEKASEYNEASPSLKLTRDGELFAMLSFHDALRSDARAVVRSMNTHMSQSILLSGDRSEVVQAVAQEVGMDHWQGGMLPAEKTERIKQLQQEGRHVLMVGDGLNDAPSLAQADVSLSPASGMDITQNAADIVFQGEKLSPILYTWRMARFSTQLVKQNFTLAVLYNCVAIPLAVAGMVTPLIAAIAMSLSSLIVIANSFRIHLIKEEAV